MEKGADIRMMMGRSIQCHPGTIDNGGSSGDANLCAPWNGCFICSLVGI